MKQTKKIILSGGGTAGSVSPLLALAESLKNSCVFDYKFLWVGTKNGIEKQMAAEAGIPYKAISAGKLRRYFSFNNFVDIFRIIFAFFQSILLLIKEKPDLIMSAGGFVSVPLVWAAWLFRKKVIIHQQDFRPGLANKLMSPFAGIISVVFEKSLADYGGKAVWTGNPVRTAFSTYSEKHLIKLNRRLPLILAVGGGTGSLAINQLICENLEKLLNFSQIIHITGKEKQKASKKHENYQAFDFVSADLMSELMRKSQIVVSRAGMNFLTELSYLGKPSILIPMPNTHQEENAKIFHEKRAAIVLDQINIDSEILVSTIKKILADRELEAELSFNIKNLLKSGENEKTVKIIEDFLRK
jgi:UDP-N-acetylglucosamine--N-acetylmuramyl-(pentapeptide) pyrophosphoryl-undecaprenol N-acetylglucosamine transferase